MIAVFDVTNLASFEAIPSYLDEIALHISSSGANVVKILVGNKIDRTINDPSCRQVSRAAAEAFAAANNLLYIETSAKSPNSDPTSASAVFTLLIEKILEKPDLLAASKFAADKIYNRKIKALDTTSDSEIAESSCCLYHL